MNKRIVLLTIISTLAVMLLFMAGVYSYNHYQYSNEISYQPVTISSLSDDVVDGQLVKMKGYLVKRINRDKYIFKTDNHSVIVEIDDFVFPKQAFGQNTLIHIIGEVDVDFLEPVTVEVEHIEVL